MGRRVLEGPLSPEDAMVKAMALIAAEFDRMQREAKREKEASRALIAESKAPLWAIRKEHECRPPKHDPTAPGG